MLATRTMRATAILFAVAAFSCFLSQDAQAQCGHRGYRSGGLRISVGYRGGGYLGRSVGYYGRRHRVWHDTSHFDYHPGRYVRHGRHYDYLPGHYDYHRTGHWHH